MVTIGHRVDHARVRPVPRAGIRPYSACDMIRMLVRRLPGRYSPIGPISIAVSVGPAGGLLAACSARAAGERADVAKDPLADAYQTVAQP